MVPTSRLGGDGGPVTVSKPAFVRTHVLGCPVDVVNMSQAVAALIELVEAHRANPSRPPALVITLNPEMVMLARRDQQFRQATEAAALLVPDGIGLVRALRRRGHPGAVRVGGTDMLTTYLPHAARLGHRIAFAGAGPGVAQEARRRLVERTPGLQIVATDAGAPDEALAERLRPARPDVVWSAFGQGRQERFVLEHVGAIGAGVGIGVGGALDYFSGRTPRAPAVLRNAGLEWAWRLVLQPWRLRRQLVLPKFWLLERAEAVRRGAKAGVGAR
jgi:N-acetylglucosaminyldiphosphoundecaprenol N-acetyl-beta-D-mannosaminyltransferase